MLRSGWQTDYNPVVGVFVFFKLKVKAANER